MRISLNGVESVASRGIPPLSAFPSATFGCWCANGDRSQCSHPPAMDIYPLSIAEVMIFRQALTADQRKFYEDNLFAKYNLPRMLP
jgi:hypothetical protein